MLRNMYDSMLSACMHIFHVYYPALVFDEKA